MKHFNVVVQVEFPRAGRVPSSESGDVAGYFVNVGVWAEAPGWAEKWWQFWR